MFSYNKFSVGTLRLFKTENKSALVEINSDAVEYFNPDMEDEIKLKMLKILDNFDYRKKLIEKGNHHFKKFSWDQTVKETIKILFN